jgi:septal ring factor EnvC (AmiA/AmiB activator)
MLIYYDYLNRARGQRIGATNDELARLRRVAAESRETRQALTRLRDERAEELESLATARRERGELLDRLDRSIADSGREIDELRAEETRLGELIAELAVALEGFPVESEAPFSAWRGRLSWPLEGRVAADFGQLREGGPLRWNGVLLDAAAGTPVRAIYHGRVAFAGWLQGMGMLLVIDHGEQFMSLYGHNQALLREPGDWVRPGEVVAEVGDTGGRRAPALYFEIRRAGEPEDPHEWIP